MSASFAMVGDPDAGACVDGVCVLPAAADPGGRTDDTPPADAPVPPVASATEVPPA